MDRISLQSRACAACNSDEKKLLYSQRFEGVSDGSLLTGYDIKVCQSCGFCFADNLPEQAAFDKYYREMSKYEYQYRGGQQSEYDHRRFPATAKLIKQFVPDQQVRILDVGCSTGGLLHTLSQSGYQNVLGLDPSPVCAQTAKNLYQIRVLTGTLSGIPAGMGRFDLIILGSVLEHIRDLRPALARLRCLLSAKGMLYVEVPDATRFADAPDAPFQEFSIEHINFFSVTALANLLRTCGFNHIVSQQISAEQSAGTMVHEVKAVFQKDDDRGPTLPIVRDTDTEQGLVAYIVRSQEIEDQIRPAIDALAVSSRPTVVWGVGTHTQRLLATTRLAEANICAFVDSNPRYQGKQLNGIPIIAPPQLKNRSEPILISSRVFQQEIERQIRDELQCGNEVIRLYDMGTAGE